MAATLYELGVVRVDIESDDPERWSVFQYHRHPKHVKSLQVSWVGLLLGTHPLKKKRKAILYFLRLFLTLFSHSNQLMEKITRKREREMISRDLILPL